MSGRLGLVSYAGDSEISDEDEIEHESTGHTPPAVVMQGLGIPPSRSKRLSTTPPPFAPPVVQSAPSMGLVAYNEDDEMNDSRDDNVFAPPPGTGDTDSSNMRDTGDQSHQESNQTNTNATLSVEIIDEPKSEAEYDSETLQPLFLPLHNVQLPPEPPGRCSKALQDKVIALLQKEEKLGLDLNQHLQGRKDFRNPSIYEKLVTALNLDEFGTNFPEHLYDPKEWGEESTYTKLLEAQKKAYEKKEKAKLQDRTKIEFVKGTKRPAVPGSVSVAGVSGAVAGDSVKKARKSKWDVSTADSSGGSKGNTPNKLGEIGAQARAQATHLSKELSMLAK